MRTRPTFSAALAVALAAGVLACGSSGKSATTSAASAATLADLSRKCKQSPAEVTALINQGKAHGLQHESAAAIATNLDALVTRLTRNGARVSCRGLMGALVISSLEHPQQ